MRTGTSRRGKRRLRSLQQVRRLEQLDAERPDPPTRTGGREPPAPPLVLTPALAADPETEGEILWRIAREEPELRQWLVINPNADARLLEYVSQAGGPGVRRALGVLFDSLDALESEYG